MPGRVSTNSVLFESPQMPHHTDVAQVFESFGGRQREYNWLLTGDDRFFDGGRPTWLSGAEFEENVEETRPVYSWAVLSAFEPHEHADLDADRLPYADGNRSLWLPYPQPQHPQATLEIVCFDNSLTLLLSRERELTRRFRGHFTDAVDLNEYIEANAGPDLRDWEAAARALPPVSVVTVPVIGAGDTTGSVELAPGIQATLHVKQMRAAGFGPSHWFAMSEYLKPGDRVVVRVIAIDAEAGIAAIEFLRRA
jgi:hypothetical protein